jgi:hypothetical protein
MANRYSIDYTNQVNDVFQVLIEPKQEYDLLGDPIPIGSTIYLTGASGTFQLTSNFNDSDKTFVGVVSKELQVGYIYDPNGGVDVETFVNDNFDYWTVSVFVNGNPIPFFKGYLAFEASQPLFDRKEVVILKATDGLSALKGVEAYEGIGKNTPLFYLIQLFGQLAIRDVNLRTLCNVTHTLMTSRLVDPTFDPLDNMLIEDKLFSGLSGYEAMQLICQTFRARIYQESGYYWFEHIGERMLTQYYAWSEYEIPGTTTLGNYDYNQVDNKIIQDIRVLIGHDKPVKLVNADAIKYIQIPKKSVKLTYNYITPKELFCQQEPKDGNLVSSGPNTGADFIFSDADYETFENWNLDCWELYQGAIDGGTLIPIFPEYYKIMLDVNGDEVDRFIVVSQPTNSINTYKLHSERFELAASDKIQVSMEMRSQLIDGFMIGSGGDWDYTANGGAIVHYGDSGEIYYLTTDGQWVTDETFALKYRYEGQTSHTTGQSVGTRSMSWQLMDTELSEPVPESGQCSLVLIAGYNYDPGGFENDTFIKSIKVNVKFSALGTYRDYIGDYNKQTAAHNAADTLEETVKISDWVSHSVLGGIYKLSLPRESYYPQWDYYGNFVTKRRFTELMSGVLASHTRRSLIKIETSFKSYSFFYGEAVYLTGFLPRYQFTDFSLDKEFMLTGSYEADLTTGICRGVFVETLRDKRAAENGNSTYYEFKYITE